MAFRFRITCTGFSLSNSHLDVVQAFSKVVDEGSCCTVNVCKSEPGLVDDGEGFRWFCSMGMSCIICLITK